MKGIIKYWKYKQLLRRLNIAKRQELNVMSYCKVMEIDFDDVNLRLLNRAIDKVRATWLRRNAID